MDFHSLSRKELQTLCKKNKIPANITNVAMADALKSLQFVEGIEEILNPSQSVTALSSIESPEKSEVSSPCVPRTGGRTTRRKTVKDDVENSQTMTRARRSTRKLVVGEVDEKSMVETPAMNHSRRTPVASVRRKMDIQLKEVEEDEKIGNEDVSETPGVLPSSRRRGLMIENTMTRTYGTRRSARLAGKNSGGTSLKENGKLQTVKSELFSEESGETPEILDMNVKGSSDDHGEIIQSTDVELKEELEEEGLETNNVKEVNAANGLKTVVHSEVCEEKDPSADSFDEPLGMHDDVQEKSGGGDLYLYKAEDALENGNKLDAKVEMVSENVAAETIEAELISQDDVFTINDKTLKTSEEGVDLIEDGDWGSSDSDNVSLNAEENGMRFQDGLIDDLEANNYSEDLAAFDISDGGVTKEDDASEITKKENDMGFQDGLANDLEASKYSEDLAAFDINCGGLTKEDGFYPSLAEGSEVFLPEAEEKGLDLVSVLESITLDDSDSLEEEHVNNSLMEKTAALELNATANLLFGLQSEETAKSDDVEDSEKSPTEQLEMVNKTDGLVSYDALPVHIADDIGETSVFNLTADTSKVLTSSAATELSHNVLPTCLTPSKKSASKKTPATTKKLSHVFDDKENIDNSGTKLMITKEEKKKKDFGLQAQYVDVSLRKLKKELKEKLDSSKQVKKDEHVMSSRPALQAVSENIVGE